MKDWTTETLGNLCEVVSGVTKDAKKAGRGLREVPYLRVANVQRMKLSLEDVRVIPATEADIDALRLLPGDVLLNEGGDRDKLGRGWIWEGQVKDCIHQNHVFRARVRQGRALPKWIAYFTNTDFAQDFFLRSGKQTTNLASISSKNLKALPIVLPPLPEQHRIVAAIEAHLTRLDAAVASLTRAKANVKRARASVLKAAVEGRLVPTEAALARAEGRAYEPADVLLARILKERRQRWVEAGGKGTYKEPVGVQAPGGPGSAGRGVAEGDTPPLPLGEVRAKRGVRAAFAADGRPAANTPPPSLPHAGGRGHTDGADGGTGANGGPSPYPLPEGEGSEALGAGLPEGWVWATMDGIAYPDSSGICAGPFGTIFKAHDFRTSGVPIIFLRHIRGGIYQPDYRPTFMDSAVWERLYREQYSVEGGELLVAKLGEPPGESAVFPTGRGPAMLTPDVMKLKTDPRVIHNRFVLHFLNSQTARQAAFGAAFGTTRLRLTLPLFRALPLPLPPLAEQHRIVAEVDRRLSVLDALDTTLDTNLKRCERLRQAILKRAFEGRLVGGDTPPMQEEAP